MRRLRAPDGCLQYFDEDRGEVKGYNLGEEYQDYAVCFR